MVLFGAIIGVVIIAIDVRQEKRGSDFRVPVLAVAVGIYLPIELTVPIFIGGMVAHLTKQAGADESMEKRGLLMASGLITGEALMGIMVAVPIFVTAQKNWWPTVGGFSWLGPVLFIGVIAWLYRSVMKR